MSVPILRSPTVPDDPWVLFVSEGRQATAVVTSSWGNRTLIVDGDPEAAATGNARKTEELLAVLPLILHPSPERYLEIGLGSGITLGTASRFELDVIDCVEISDAVIQSATFFEPDNGGVARANSAATIINQDARRLLAQRPARYDVISANTLHPWSVGATGLYSLEYFERMAAALRPSGIAVQWIPTQQIGGESVSLILRTFFEAFPHGSLWWGAGNIIAVGSLTPIEAFQAERADNRIRQAELSWPHLGWASAEDVPRHRIASADDVRHALGDGNRLEDDRPLLEFYAIRSANAERASNLYRVLVEIAEQDVNDGAMLFWLESLVLRATEDLMGANARESLAADLGLDIAAQARVSRIVAKAHQDLQAGRSEDALSTFNSALNEDPKQRYALFGRSGVRIKLGELESAISDLEEIVATWPNDVRAWNELAGIHAARGDLTRAQFAIKRALAANPYDMRGLANFGLIALEMGDRDLATAMLARLRAISPLGSSSQESFLTDSLAKSNRE